MAITVKRRWLGIFGAIISILSSLLTSYVQSNSNVNPIAPFVEVQD